MQPSKMMDCQGGDLDAHDRIDSHVLSSASSKSSVAPSDSVSILAHSPDEPFQTKDPVVDDAPGPGAVVVMATMKPTPDSHPPSSSSSAPTPTDLAYKRTLNSKRMVRTDTLRQVIQYQDYLVPSELPGRHFNRAMIHQCRRVMQLNEIDPGVYSCFSDLFLSSEETITYGFPTFRMAYQFGKDFAKLCGFQLRIKTTGMNRKEGMIYKYVCCQRQGLPEVSQKTAQKIQDAHQGILNVSHEQELQMGGGQKKRRLRESVRCNCRWGCRIIAAKPVEAQPDPVTGEFQMTDGDADLIWVWERSEHGYSHNHPLLNGPLAKNEPQPIYRHDSMSQKMMIQRQPQQQAVSFKSSQVDVIEESGKAAPVLQSTMMNSQSPFDILLQADSIVSNNNNSNNKSYSPQVKRVKTIERPQVVSGPSSMYSLYSMPTAIIGSHSIGQRYQAPTTHAVTISNTVKFNLNTFASGEASKSPQTGTNPNPLPTPITPHSVDSKYAEAGLQKQVRLNSVSSTVSQGHPQEGPLLQPIRTDRPVNKSPASNLPSIQFLLNDF